MIEKKGLEVEKAILVGIITKNRVSLLNDKLLEIQKMLNSYITKLKISNLLS